MTNPNRLMASATLALSLAIGTSACSRGESQKPETPHNVLAKPATWDTDFLQHTLDSDMAEVCSDAGSGDPYPSTSLEVSDYPKHQRFYSKYRSYAQKKLVDQGLGWIYFSKGDTLPKDIQDLDQFC